MIEVCQTDVVCGDDMTCQLIQTDERAVHDVSFHQQADERQRWQHPMQCAAHTMVLTSVPNFGMSQYHIGLTESILLLVMRAVPALFQNPQPSAQHANQLNWVGAK